MNPQTLLKYLNDPRFEIKDNKLVIDSPGVKLSSISEFFDAGLSRPHLGALLPEHDTLPLDLTDIWLESLTLTVPTAGLEPSVEFTLAWEKLDLTLAEEMQLTEIRVRFEITPWWERATLSGLLTIHGTEFDVEIELPSLVLHASLKENSQPDGLKGRLPSPGPNSAPIIKDVSVTALLRLGVVRFHFTVEQLLVGLPLEIGAMQVSLTYDDGISAQVWGDLIIEVPGNPVEILIAADVSETSWHFSGSLSPQGLQLGALLDHLFEKFQSDPNSLPDLLNDLKVTSLAVEYDTASGDFRFALSFPVSDTASATVGLEIALQKSSDGYQRTIEGSLELGGYTFELILEKDTDSQDEDSQTLIASLKPDAPLDFKALLSGLISDTEVLELMPDLHLDIQNVVVCHRKQDGDTTNLLVLTMRETASIDLLQVNY